MTIGRLTTILSEVFNLPRPEECGCAHILLKRLSRKIPKSIILGKSSSRERRKQPARSLFRFRTGYRKRWKVSKGMPEGARSASAGTDVKTEPRSTGTRCRWQA